MKPREDIIPFPPRNSQGLLPEFSGHSLLRNVSEIFFRNRIWFVSLWALVTIAVGSYAIVTPREYESEMTLLVRSNRADTVLSAEGASSFPQARQTDISDAQISTEVQLLTNREILEKLLPLTGFNSSTIAGEQERALAKLKKDLIIAPIVKSNMIRVRYSNPDPKRAAQVLDALSKAYLDQHLRLLGNTGSFEFFDQQSADAEKRWKAAQGKLLDFQRASGVVSAVDQKDLLLRRQIELQASLHAAEAELRETNRKLEDIKPKLEGLSGRIATQSRRVPNMYSVERMNTMLIELQNRRTELLSKFRPTERVVTQLDQQIADTQKALQAADSRTATEEATDVNPLRQTLESDLARGQGYAAGLAGRIQSMRAQDQAYRQQLTRLESQLPVEQQLLREVKLAEDNYLLYTRKREEARIGQRMDQQKIANVVVAEAPQVPALPRGRLNTLAIVYLTLLLLCSLVAALGSRMRQTVDTPWGLEIVTELPVLGTVPVHKSSVLPKRMRGFS